MKELDLERRTYREYAQRSAGIYPGDHPHSDAQQRLAGHEADLFTLPEELSTATMQGAGGGWYFALDYHDLDAAPLL